MTKEKIISLARECGMAVSTGGNGYWDHVDQMEAFYHKAQAEAFEAAAKSIDKLYANGYDPAYLVAMSNETILNLFLLAANIVILYTMSWVINKHTKALKEHREYLEKQNAD